MRILAVNTATDALSAGVIGPEGGHEWLSPPMAAGRGHSEVLLPVVERLLEQAGLSPGDLEGVAVVDGPGGFTGVRSGLVMARTLAHVLALPVAGVDALEALAVSSGQEGDVMAMLDARREMVFASSWRVIGGKAQAIQEARLLSLEEVLVVVRSRTFTCVGEGARVHRARIRDAGGHVPAAHAHAIRPAVVATLARPALERGGTPPRDLQPRYLRAPAMARDWMPMGEGEPRR